MNVSLLRRALALASAALLSLLLTACGPTYPECEEDKDCREQGEYCLNAKCAQCRDDSHCGSPCGLCNGGKCSRITNCCASNADCSDPTRGKCDNNRCVPFCYKDSDCKENEICEKGVCKFQECVEDKECIDKLGPGHECVKNRCEKIKLCELKAIYFDFDEYYIRADAKTTLEENAECMGSREEIMGSKPKVNLVGHCDERGTEQYNMNLGLERSKRTRKEWSRMGVDKDLLTFESKGEYELAVPNATTESQHQRNRRVVFQPQQ